MKDIDTKVEEVHPDENVLRENKDEGDGKASTCEKKSDERTGKDQPTFFFFALLHFRYLLKGGKRKEETASSGANVGNLRAYTRPSLYCCLLAFTHSLYLTPSTQA